MGDRNQQNRRNRNRKRHRSCSYSRSATYSAIQTEEHSSNLENETKEELVKTQVYAKNSSGCSRNGYHQRRRSFTEQNAYRQIDETPEAFYREASYFKGKHPQKLKRKQAGSINTLVSPDADEVFKYLVKEMIGLCNPEDINKTTALFRECGNIEEWFRRRKKQFIVFEQDNKILKVGVFVKDASYCLDYLKIKGVCRLPDCTRYHICKDLITGFCSFQNRCKFSHDTLDDHNYPVTCRLGFQDVFDNEQVIHILSLRFPRVCDSWNILGYCSDTSCCKLHMCQKYITGTCYQGEECTLEHKTSADQNQMVTKAYHMLNWNLPLLCKLVFVPKPASKSYRREKHQLGACKHFESASTEDWTKDYGVAGTSFDESISRSYPRFPEATSKTRKTKDVKK